MESLSSSGSFNFAVSQQTIQSPEISHTPAPEQTPIAEKKDVGTLAKQTSATSLQAMKQPKTEAKSLENHKIEIKSPEGEQNAKIGQTVNHAIKEHAQENSAGLKGRLSDISENNSNGHLATSISHSDQLRQSQILGQNGSNSDVRMIPHRLDSSRNPDAVKKDIAMIAKDNEMRKMETKITHNLIKFLPDSKGTEPLKEKIQLAVKAAVITAQRDKDKLVDSQIAELRNNYVGCEPLMIGNPERPGKRKLNDNPLTETESKMAKTPEVDHALIELRRSGSFAGGGVEGQSETAQIRQAISNVYENAEQRIKSGNQGIFPEHGADIIFARKHIAPQLMGQLDKAYLKAADAAYEKCKGFAKKMEANTLTTEERLEFSQEFEKLSGLIANLSNESKEKLAGDHKNLPSFKKAYTAKLHSHKTTNIRLEG